MSDNAETREALTPEAFRAAHDAVKETFVDLGVDWTAHQPIQGESMPKVLAYRVALAVLAALPPVAGPEVRPDETLRALSEADRERAVRAAQSIIAGSLDVRSGSLAEQVTDAVLTALREGR